MCEELRLTIANDLQDLARVHELVNALLERRGVKRKVAFTTTLAIEEVLSNVIRHGYRDSTRHEIALCICVGEGEVQLQVVDDGLEFDPTTAPAVDLGLPLAERPVGGLGIHLLRSLVSEIRYERAGGRNHLWLRI